MIKYIPFLVIAEILPAESTAERLAQGGVLAIICGLLIWRDIGRQKEQSRQNAAYQKNKDAEMIKLFEQQDKDREALKDLIEVTAIEVMSRENVVKRMRDKAGSILKKIQERE